MTPGGSQSPPGVVVVTGASRYLGAHVAARLAADPRIDRVIGIDQSEPGPEVDALLDQVEWIRVDAGSVGGLLADLDVDTVVHLALVSSPDPQHGGRAAMKEQNVIGTMQLLAACQRAPRLRKIVVRSSTAAYGASFRDPAVFTEETEPREVPRGGFGRDILDIEGYVRGFRRRRGDVTATVLRFAPFIGSTADTTLTRYFAQPVVPTIFGRDARLQFLHFDDALEVLHRSVVVIIPAPSTSPGPACSRCRRRSVEPVGSPCRCWSRACPVPSRWPGSWASVATASTRSTSSCTDGWWTSPGWSGSTPSRPARPPPPSTISSGHITGAPW